MKNLRIILLMIIALGIGYYLGTTKVALAWKAYKPVINVSGKEPPSGMQNADFSMMWTVLNELETKYYDKSVIVPQKLVDGAITGMVASLDDPYTMYLPPTQNDNFKQVMAGQFEGIGAELGMNGKQIIIVAPLAGSPSEKAGIKAGDAVLKVDGAVTAGWTIDQAVNKIRGPKGTDVTLTVLHKGDQLAQDISIKRDTIQVKSVASWTKAIKDIPEINSSSSAVLKANAGNEVAYIRLAQFGDQTNQEWGKITSDIALNMQKDKKIKGVILDLRNNPGGYLTDAVFIASEFIKDGTVVTQAGGNGENQTLTVSRQGLLLNTPVVVLINGGSASASEIVSGALRDHGRAKLVGDKSFGKGTVQQAEDLGGGAGVHITIAKWLTPNGTWVGNGKNGTGLIPDVKVSLDPKDPSHDTQLEKGIETLLTE